MEKHSIRDWWSQNPMTYGDKHGGMIYNKDHLEMGGRSFFERLDREFYSWNKPLHNQKPFDRLFPYENYGEGSRF